MKGIVFDVLEEVVVAHHCAGAKPIRSALLKAAHTAAHRILREAVAGVIRR